MNLEFYQVNLVVEGNFFKKHDPVDFVSYRRTFLENFHLLSGDQRKQPRNTIQGGGLSIVLKS